MCCVPSNSQLLGADGREWVDVRGANGRQQRGDAGDEGQQKRGSSEHEWIVGRGAVEEAGEGACSQESCGEPRERTEDLRMLCRIGTRKALRHHTDDGERDLVGEQLAADHMRVAMQGIAPVTLGDDGGKTGWRTGLVVCRDEIATAQGWCLERAKILAADEDAAHQIAAAGGSDLELRIGGGEDIAERGVVALHVAEKRCRTGGGEAGPVLLI